MKEEQGEKKIHSSFSKYTLEVSNKVLASDKWLALVDQLDKGFGPGT